MNFEKYFEKEISILLKLKKKKFLELLWFVYLITSFFSLCVQISWFFNSVESEFVCLPNYYLFTELISVHLGYNL